MSSAPNSDISAASPVSGNTEPDDAEPLLVVAGRFVSVARGWMVFARSFVSNVGLPSTVIGSVSNVTAESGAPTIV